MACFLVPTAEAIVTTVAAKTSKEKEAKQDESKTLNAIPFSRKLSWLRNMLWGGAALLAFEHVWHGEVVPYFPFLTATSNPQDKAQMLREMATVGVVMAALVTVVWLCMLAVCAAIEKREQGKAVEEN